MVAPTAAPAVRTVLAALRAAVSDEPPTFPQADPAWDRVYAIARHHHLVPLVYEGLAAKSPSPPIQADLRRDVRENARRNLHATMQLHRILEAFDDAGVDALPYKGPVLAAGCYGGLHRRTFFDLDLLVPQSAVRTAGRVLCQRGYEPDAAFRTVRALGPATPFLGSPVECEFSHPETGTVVELRWRLGAWGNTLDLSVPELRRRCSSIPVAGRKLPALSPADRLVVLAAHGTKHAWRRLGWLVDVAMVFSDDERASDVDWSTAVSRAEAWGAKLPLAIAVILVTTLFEVAVPERVREALRTPRAEALAQRALTRLLTTPLGRPGVVEGLLYNVLSTDTERGALVFALRRAFQPRPEDYRTLPLPRPCWPLYLLTRCLRTGTFFARQLYAHASLPSNHGSAKDA